MSNVRRLPVAGALVSKQQLAQHLNRSTRWIEMRVNEGMPSENLDRYGRRQFNVAAVESWLAAGKPQATTLAERLEQMEREMASLRTRIRQLETDRRAG